MRALTGLGQIGKLPFGDRRNDETRGVDDSAADKVFTDAALGRIAAGRGDCGCSRAGIAYV